MKFGENIAYYLLKVIFLFLSKLPWMIISLLSFIFSFIIKIVGYRKNVILENLKQSFPEKSDKEIGQILSDFYYNFTFQVLSSPKLLHQKANVIKSKHFIMENKELFSSLKEKGHKAIFAMMGHYGNWELFSAGQIYMDEMGLQQEQIYRPQKNKAIDILIAKLRGRFGSISLPKDNAPRRIVSALRDNDKCSLFAFIADQSPSAANVHYFTKFLGRETAFLTGAERLARKFNIPVVYMDVIFVEKGCYRCEINLLSDSPRDLEPMELTERYARAMEKTILRDPSHWLWSHKRWKINSTDFPQVQRSKDL